MSQHCSIPCEKLPPWTLALPRNCPIVCADQEAIAAVPGMAVEQRLCMRSPAPADQGKGPPSVFSWLPVWNYTCCHLASHLPRVTSSLFLQCRWRWSCNSQLEFPAFPCFPCFLPRCFLFLPYKTPNSPPSPFNNVIKCNEIEVNLRQSSQDACTLEWDESSFRKCVWVGLKPGRCRST